MACSNTIELSDFLTVTTYDKECQDKMKAFLDMIEEYDGYRYTPLHVAIAVENVALLQAALDTHEFDEELENILVFALLENDADEIWKKMMCSWNVFKCLVDAGAKVDCLNDNDDTLLDMTYQFSGTYKELEIVKIRNHLRGQGVKYTIRKREKEEERRYQEERKCREEFAKQFGYDAFKKKYFEENGVEEDEQFVPEFDGTEEEYEALCAEEEKRYPNEF